MVVSQHDTVHMHGRPAWCTRAAGGLRWHPGEQGEPALQVSSEVIPYAILRRMSTDAHGRLRRVGGATRFGNGDLECGGARLGLTWAGIVKLTVSEAK